MVSAMRRGQGGIEAAAEMKSQALVTGPGDLTKIFLFGVNCVHFFSSLMCW